MHEHSQSSLPPERTRGEPHASTSPWPAAPRASAPRCAPLVTGGFAVAIFITASLTPLHAETGSSGWVQRTTPAPVTQPEKNRKTSRPKKRRAKTKSVPRLKPGIVPPSLSAGKPAQPARSTLGPIMADPTGENAAYIAFDQGQYLTALQLARGPAEKDDPQAITLIGRIYEKGLGVPRDELQAARLYRRAAELGDTEAVFAFAVMLAAGRGIQKNIDGAANLFERAARKGHPEANYNLGLLFIAGTGKPENPRRARMHIEYAAKRGLAAAQYDLAALYAKGHGAEPDAYMATRWLRAAANAGMASAQYDYAVRLLQGGGFNRDKPEIVSYLTRAARQGIAGAQNRLAHIYAAGVLVRRNMLEAAKWRFIAAATGFEARGTDRKLDKRIAALPKATRDKAQRLAAGFIEGASVGTVLAAR